MEVLRVLLLLLLMLRRFEAVEEKLDLQLAEKLIGDNCRTAANRTAFYLQIREMQGMARRFPTWPNGETIRAGSGLASADGHATICRGHWLGWSSAILDYHRFTH